MAFLFSTSHLPETRVRRPDHQEEDDDEDSMSPPPRAGMVRAFSHLPEPRPLADSSGPLSTRSATPAGRTRPYVDPEADTGHDDVPEADSGPYEPEITRLWHSPRNTAQYLPPQNSDEDRPGSRLNRPARSSGFDDSPPAGRSATTTRSNGFSPSPQDLHDAFHSPAPADSPAGQAPAQDNRPALPGGRLFEQRSAPEAFLTQQLGKGASGLPRQQRLQGSERTLAAQQQQPVREATTAAPGGRLAAQQQAQPPAAAPAQNVPAAPQPPAAGGAKRQPCADCQAKLDAALTRLCELEAEEYAIRTEIGRQFKIAEDADKEWFAANAKGDDAAGKAAILKEARAKAAIERLNHSLFKPKSEAISIQQVIEALRNCIHSDPFELK